MWSPWFQTFLVYLFVLACSASVSSNSERPCCSACLQAERSESTVSHLLMSMLKAFRSLWQTSLQRNHWGLPVGHFPRAYSQWKRSFWDPAVAQPCSLHQDYIVWNFFLPGDTEHAAETAHVENVKLPLLSYEKSPGLSAVQRCAQNTGSVDLDLVIFRQLLVGPYSLGQAGNGSDCLALLFGSESREEVS